VDALVSAETIALRMAETLTELGGELSERFEQSYVTLAKERIREAVRRCREGGLEHLSDVMAIDWLEYPRHAGPRFTDRKSVV
jgi:NADH:ubiquinone oxidoreductase subunit C